ncbi:MAG: hypothetical protein K9J17_08670 [Flavobacteriales bacterium]|nr:hypothetical protein [Flavobacteriales bacterium]
MFRESEQKAKQYKKLYDGPDFVVLKGRKDTIFCDKVEMKMSSNDPIKLSFQIDGRDTVIKGTDCRNAIAFKTEGAIMELMPANPEKPEKAQQHMFRSTEGYITIWSNNHKHIDKFKMPNELGRVHTIQYILASVDGGPLFIPSIKNYKKYLMPLFEECKEMNKSGFSDFFSGVIRLSESYNETCGKDK